MKTVLLNLSLLLFIITSCNKSPEQITQASTDTIVPPKPFAPVYLFGGPGGWGGGICSWGWIMVREDSSSIVYHATHLPPGVTITTNPVSVKIQYHDTANIMGGCWDDIVVDSLSF